MDKFINKIKRKHQQVTDIRDVIKNMKIGEDLREQFQRRVDAFAKTNPEGLQLINQYIETAKQEVLNWMQNPDNERPEGKRRRRDRVQDITSQIFAGIDMGNEAIAEFEGLESDLQAYKDQFLAGLETTAREELVEASGEEVSSNGKEHPLVNSAPGKSFVGY